MATTAGSGGAVSARRRPAARVRTAAADLPVARVAVDMPLAHLDRPFDYLVPESLAERAVAGCRVRVRFAGQLTGGFILDRVATSDHSGRLAFLERVVSPEPVLSPEVAALAREVADRYAGTLADVLRLAVPPRHAGVEQSAAPSAPPPPRPGRPGPGGWARYGAGPAFLTALTQGRAPRAVWTALPGTGWPEEIARAAATAAAAGRGSLVVVPDARDLALIDTALARTLGPGHHTCLAAGLGPAERYRRWLEVRRGAVRVVAGTRAAMFAPVQDLGLVVVWDDGDDLHAEPRAPYPHAREVLALRAHRARAAALIGGFARTAEATSLVASGWAAAVTADRATVRRHAPLVQATGDDSELARDAAARSARVPSLALRTAREGLTRGPVLVQVPRRGYLGAVACVGCGSRASCPDCGGPLAVEARDAPARCRWCGHLAGQWQCPGCGGSRMRAVVAGARRTAEELARAFPGAKVLTSGGTDVLTSVPPEPAVVVATPGAEPGVANGYTAAVLLDGWALLGRPGLDAAQEALRRWMNAAALVVPGSQGGRVTVVAEASLPTVQAFIRWDPVTHAERELAERSALGFPPAVRMASLTGPPEAVEDLLGALVLPQPAEVLGPVDMVGDSAAPGADGAQQQVRALVRIPRAQAAVLATALRTAQGVRSARKAGGQVRVQIDPAAPV
ncbi:MAG TPA: primosomal protein N' [Streptosporangiaceae bacterium]|nr:primosomal protein N' [Streptosporangiaceae bacterium]